MEPIKENARDDGGEGRQKGDPYVVTEERRKQVQTMAGLGIREDAIALILRVHKNTLRKHHADDLARGRVVADMAVADALFRAATSGSKQGVAAAIFWAKTRMGWREQGDDEEALGPKVRVLAPELAPERAPATPAAPVAAPSPQPPAAGQG